MTQNPVSDLVLVAQIGAAHGIQGEFKLLSFMDEPVAVLEYAPLLNDKGQAALTITAAREHKGALIVRAAEVADRTAAERLKGLQLYIARADLPEPDEDEYYITDLIGMAVRDSAGQPVGRVVNVENFGAGDLLDIQPLEGANFYLLFSQENVPDVRLTERTIIVDLSGI
ncbi:ribosome maturation factor RimM [Asticcacaulis sp. EMRT-3]|uniref:ribosome maturation factor RimM n=1 Tax=Asticcacaulis sp. EMRT-3 TaxID=3040349 RepID=UPI0024AF9800|nr:ribosome maturation factor RimM [Asticcacaulis sp. EMRT-3]MDI7775683.1 ribosome maturation factor RimM [Asticcacaulis sp. EMRT-3]